MSKQKSKKKLKAEIAQLHSDMRIIVGNEFSVEREIIKRTYRDKYQIEDLIWRTPINCGLTAEQI